MNLAPLSASILLLPLPAARATSPAQGDCPVGWVSTFDGQPGTNQPLAALAVFDDGSGSGPALHAGGHFTAAGGTLASRVARWDGTGWTPLEGGLDGIVNALAVFDDGGGPALYAGGSFLNADGVPASGIARWNGTSWSAVGSGVGGGNVHALTVFDDGSGPALYAGGTFISAGGVPANHIARWDGSSWTKLGSGVSAPGFSSVLVLSLSTFDDGSGPALYAGGTFSIAGGVVVNNVARWNGSAWSALASGVGPVGTSVTSVEALAVFDDGTGPALYAGGNFTIAGGAPASRIARWDGASWAPLGSGIAGVVSSLLAFDDGSGPALFAGGQFNFAGGIEVNCIARWQASSWSALGSGVRDTDPIFANPDVWALAAFDDGSGAALHIGGNFTSAGDASASNVARWDGSSWHALQHGLDAPVLAAAVFDDGSGGGPALYAGGDFLSAGGVPVTRVARWDGASWTALGAGTSATVQALAVFDDGLGAGPVLIAGGRFGGAGGVLASRVAAWDGTNWSPLGAGVTGGNLSVEALLAFDDGSGPALYVGGDFTVAGGVQAFNIARWDGLGWAPLGSGTNGAVKALCVFDDGSGPALYAGGSFSSAGGQAVSGIARWNGASWAPLAGGVNGTVVAALATYDDGSGPALYAGGRFTSAGGIAAKNIARWNGASWSPLGNGRPEVHALIVYDPGAGPALHVGTGEATEFFTPPPGPRVSRWDGSGWATLASAMDLHVTELAVFDDGSGVGPALHAGGTFTASRAGDSFLARWVGCPDEDAPVLACPAAAGALDSLGGPPGEIVTFAVTASDRDPHATIVCTPPSGSSFPRGTTLVTCTATDGSGNQSSCAFPVTVGLKARPR